MDNFVSVYLLPEPRLVKVSESHLCSNQAPLFRFVAPAEEIKKYLITFTKEYDLYRHIQFDTRVRSAVWKEEEGMWKVVTSKGSLKCKILISACGALHKPSLPSIGGIQSLKGQSFHSANWDHEATLEGKRVGIVGSAASAVQIRGAQQDKNKYRIQDELYRIQYSLASIIVYGPKKQVICEKYS